MKVAYVFAKGLDKGCRGKVASYVKKMAKGVFGEPYKELLKLLKENRIVIDEDSVKIVGEIDARVIGEILSICGAATGEALTPSGKVKFYENGYYTPVQLFFEIGELVDMIVQEETLTVKIEGTEKPATPTLIAKHLNERIPDKTKQIKPSDIKIHKATWKKTKQNKWNTTLTLKHENKQQKQTLAIIKTLGKNNKKQQLIAFDIRNI